MLDTDRRLGEIRQHLDTLIALVDDYAAEREDVTTLRDRFATEHRKASQAIRRVWQAVEDDVEGAVPFLIDARFAVDAMSTLVAQFAANPGDPNTLLQSVTDVYASAVHSTHRAQHLCRAQSMAEGSTPTPTEVH